MAPLCVCFFSCAVVFLQRWLDLFAHLAYHNVGQIDWNPYLPEVRSSAPCGVGGDLAGLHWSPHVDNPLESLYYATPPMYQYCTVLYVLYYVYHHTAPMLYIYIYITYCM